MRLFCLALRHGLALTLLAGAIAPAYGQRPDELESERTGRLARRGAGVRIGTWNVDDPTRADARFSRSLQYEVFLQRGLDPRLAVENSAGVWRRVTHERQQLPAGSDTVETRAYIIPLLTSIKLYPLTTAFNTIEPFFLGGLGFALGIENRSANAIGGGGTSIVAGFGIKAAAGVEVHLGVVGISADARYQWMKLSEDLGLENTFKGVGLEGGLALRFRFK